ALPTLVGELPCSPVWAVTASACGLQGSSPTNVGSASLTTTVPIGGTVICGFENTTKTTRTQGFWSTHLAFAKATITSGTNGLIASDLKWCGAWTPTLAHLQ